MFKKIKDCNVKGKVVFLRADMNVSIKNNEIIDDTRIKATIPTIEYLIQNRAKVVLATHLGKAKGIGFEEEFSLKIVLLLINRVQLFNMECLPPAFILLF